MAEVKRDYVRLLNNLQNELNSAEDIDDLRAIKDKSELLIEDINNKITEISDHISIRYDCPVVIGGLAVMGGLGVIGYLYISDVGVIRAVSGFVSNLILNYANPGHEGYYTETVDGFTNLFSKGAGTLLGFLGGSFIYGKIENLAGDIKKEHIGSRTKDLHSYKSRFGEVLGKVKTRMREKYGL